MDEGTIEWPAGAKDLEFRVEKGKFYTVEVTYQGTLSTAYINSDLAGYTLASVLNEICPDDILILGNMGTNGMGNSFETDVSYFLNATEAPGVKIVLVLPVFTPARAWTF